MSSHLCKIFFIHRRDIFSTFNHSTRINVCSCMVGDLAVMCICACSGDFGFDGSILCILNFFLLDIGYSLQFLLQSCQLFCLLFSVLLVVHFILIHEPCSLHFCSISNSFMGLYIHNFFSHLNLTWLLLACVHCSCMAGELEIKWEMHTWYFLFEGQCNTCRTMDALIWSTQIILMHTLLVAWMDIFSLEKES